MSIFTKDNDAAWLKSLDATEREKVLLDRRQRAIDEKYFEEQLTKRNAATRTELQRFEAAVRATADYAREIDTAAANGCDDYRQVARSMVLAKRTAMMEKLLSDYTNAVAALANDNDEPRKSLDRAAELIAAKLAKLLPNTDDATRKTISLLHGDLQAEKEAAAAKERELDNFRNSRKKAARELWRLTELTAREQGKGSNLVAEFLQKGGL